MYNYAWKACKGESPSGVRIPSSLHINMKGSTKWSLFYFQTRNELARLSGWKGKSKLRSNEAFILI